MGGTFRALRETRRLPHGQAKTTTGQSHPHEAGYRMNSGRGMNWGVGNWARMVWPELTTVLDRVAIDLMCKAASRSGTQGLLGRCGGRRVQRHTGGPATKIRSHIENPADFSQPGAPGMPRQFARAAPNRADPRCGYALRTSPSLPITAVSTTVSWRRQKATSSASSGWLSNFRPFRAHCTASTGFALA